MDILYSIKPIYVDKIFKGTKKYEYRRTIFKKTVEKVYVYSSYPICRVVGEFKIDNILNLDVDKLWDKTKEDSGIDYKTYKKYFENKKDGYAIKIMSVKLFENQKSLKSFNENIKHPPQSFLYLEWNIMDGRIYLWLYL